MNLPLPKFPLPGNIISNNVTLDRISLLNNTVGNSAFFASQYAFFTKNSSIWYKFKTPTTAWSNEFLWIQNASESNTKFDTRGYPMTAYVRQNGTLAVTYFDSNINLKTVTIALSGSLPTIAMNPFDTYIFWVPPGYTNNIMYTEMVNNFLFQHNYSVTLPGNIANMQIELIENNEFMFCFEVDSGSSKKIYVATTDSAG